MFENEMTTMTTTETAEVATDVETAKKHRGRVAKPTLTLTDVLDKFDNGEVNAFYAEYGQNATKTKTIMVKVDGVATALTPANPGQSFSKQDYAKAREMMSIIDKVYPVSVKVI